MIIIDGQKSPLEVRQFDNLEQIIVKVMGDRRKLAEVLE